ncbi:hypothetical protein H4S02_003002 [Coemansia sp. RSA 2611]|nr:hypothetical protein H4S02_003002 [Coemansia sp. RSA 2611]
MACAVGYLQKKSRFYGWNKHVFLLNQHGLAQLTTERNLQPAQDQGTDRIPHSFVIGSATGIDLKHALALKHKQFVKLSNIARVSGQGSRELAVTSTAGILVLRALTTADRDLWLEAFQSAAQSTGEPDAAADACSSASAEAVSVSPTSDLDAMTQAAGSLAHSPAATTARNTPPFLLELTLDSVSADQDGVGQLGLDSVPSEARTEPSGNMGWLPSIDSLPNPIAPDVSASSPDNGPGGDEPGAQPNGSKLRLNPYMSPSPNPAPVTAGATPATAQVEVPQAASASSEHDHGLSFERDCVNMDAESFDADRFFNGDDDDVNMDTVAPASQRLAVGSTSELPLADAAGSLQAGASHAATALPDRIDADSTAFGDMFSDFLGTLARESGEGVLGHVEAEQPASLARGSEGLSADLGFSNSNVSENETKAGSNQATTHALAAGKTPDSAQLVAVATNVAEPATVLNSSIADIASSMLDCHGLPDFSALLNASHMESSSEPAQAADSDTQDDRPLLQVAAELSDRDANIQLPKPPAKALDPPGQYDLGGRSMDKLKSVASSVGLRAAHKAQLDDPPGFQTSLLAKYSDSLNASRALLSSVNRVGRPKTMHDWQANTSKANAERGMKQTAAIVQYESAGPTNTGVSKVVRGQLTKEIIQKEADRKPAVRRVRRAKSESKVLPLKAIRLKLDGSIAGSRVAANDSQAGSSRGLKYMVKDGRIEGMTGHNGSRGSLALAASQATPGDGASPNSDGVSEFSEIQKRLKQAEEHKRQLQQARLLDKDASDGVCIADIIENRQDIPLAQQLEERRRMQAAKQQALLNQQLEQQRAQLETQRMNMEQQQQYEQFKRQSLCPDVKSIHRMSTISASQPGAPNGWNEPGGDNYLHHWTHDPASYGRVAPSMASANMHSSSMQPPSFGYQQQSRPTTPISVYDPSVAWVQQPVPYQPPPPPPQQQQQQRFAGRPYSHYVQTATSSTQSADVSARIVGRSVSTGNPRRQAGAAFVKSARPASRAGQSEHSNASTDSWQSRVAHSTKTSVHANSDPLRDGSVFIASPTMSAAVAKRSSSFGYAESRRSTASRPGSQTARFCNPQPMENAPPVPPIPQHIAASSAQHAYSGCAPAQGPPGYMPSPVHHHAGHGYPQPPASYGQWAPPAPPHGWGSPYAPAQPVPYSCEYPGYNHHHQQQPGITTPQMQRKRTEMTAKVPSLLQQLNQAQVSGIMPGRIYDRPSYTKGSYQNANVPQIVRETTGAHYLGDGNTLLIDRVHESEKTRRAFLKKVSRNYTGVGGDTAPTPVFMH